jgi:hypothetical protein
MSLAALSLKLTATCGAASVIPIKTGLPSVGRTADFHAVSGEPSITLPIVVPESDVVWIAVPVVSR